jgi:hypothetical protein
MPYIIVIDKNGTVKETNIKEYKEEDLYKKANFKSAEGFDVQTVWTGLSLAEKTVSVSVYGKKAGNALQENKYEFPPPIDSVLFFGGCVLVAKSETEGSPICDLRVSSWNKIYDTLMGGFEDLGEEEEGEEELDLEEQENAANIGKSGYLRDGFVVEDEEDDGEFEDPDPDPEEESEEEEEVKPKKKPKRKTTKTSTVEKKKSDKEKEKDKKKKPTEKESMLLQDISIAAVTENYLDCSSELVEEEYV